MVKSYADKYGFPLKGKAAKEGKPVRNWIRYIQNNVDRLWVWPIILLPLLPEYFAPIAAIAAFSFACLDAVHHQETFHIGRVGKLLLIYIAYMTVGALYSEHPLNTLSSVAMWAVMFAVYLSLTTLLRSHERINQLFAGITVAAGVAGLIAVVQYVGLVSLDWDISPFFWNSADLAFFKYFPMDLDFYVPGDIRTGSTFNNQNIFAEYVVMCLPFVCHYAFTGRLSRKKLWARLCLVCAIGGIGVSLCRGAYLAVLVMGLVLVVFQVASRVPMLIAAAAGLACLPQSVSERFVSIGSGDKSATNRLVQWQVALFNSSLRPLFGYGAGVSNTTDMLHSVGVDAPHVHNLILMLLLEGGLPSVILIGIVLFTVLRCSMDMMILQRNRALSVAILAFVGGFVTVSMFDFPFMTPKLVGCFLMVMAIADVTAHLELERAWKPLFAKIKELRKISLAK